PGDTGALTRIQSGFFSSGESGRCAFSGWRGRGLLTRSRTTAMGDTYGGGGCAARSPFGRHSGARALASEPGIHIPQRCGLWIPGPALTRRPGMTEHSSRLPDRPPDQQEDDRADGGGNEVAPEIGHDMPVELVEQEA